MDEKGSDPRKAFGKVRPRPKVLSSIIHPGHPSKRGRKADYSPYSTSGRKGFAKTHAIQATIGGSGAFVADRQYAVLKYAEALFPGAAAPSFRFVYRGNSLFDPGFTAGAVQPAGFNQWQSQYSHYRVLWSKIKITPWSATTADSPNIWNLYPCNSSSPFTNTIKTSSSQPYGKQMLSWVNTQGIKGASIQNFMTTRKIWGDRTEFDTVYQAAVTANPAAPWFWIIDAETIDATNFSTSAEGVYVEITYGCYFEGRQAALN